MYKKVSIESKTKNLHVVEKLIDEISGELEINQDNYGKILVSTLEGVNNAIVHGNKSDPEKSIDIEISSFGNDLIIVITDQGDGFLPELVPDPTTPDKIEEINGRGVFIMTRLADELEYSAKGNSVKMKFKNISN